ncbi:MAG: hypothetical protein LUG51_11685, partial [Tannerellaceae bacterium]|nr:hypothetical protein [Tannerellaceae bacterium]
FVVSFFYSLLWMKITGSYLNFYPTHLFIYVWITYTLCLGLFLGRIIKHKIQRVNEWEENKCKVRKCEEKRREKHK